MRVTPAARIGAVVLLMALLAAGADAQFRRGRYFAPVRSPTPDSFDGSFNFCRLTFTSTRGGFGGNWSVDYPRADVNLSIRLSELTKTTVSIASSGEPNHLVIGLTDPALFQCPFVMITEVGSAYFTPEEAAALRLYLEKGGFMWADDFWGSYAWEHWETEIAKALPSSEYPIAELPGDHPLFRAQFQIAKVPQIPSINFWAGTGGTSEQYEDSAVARAMGIADKQGRLMVLMTHNTDVGDSWEREADDPNYFYRFSVDGYALGINTILYTMTH